VPSEVLPPAPPALVLASTAASGPLAVPPAFVSPPTEASGPAPPEPPLPLTDPVPGAPPLPDDPLAPAPPPPAREAPSGTLPSGGFAPVSESRSPPSAHPTDAALAIHTQEENARTVDSVLAPP
jgi:hypothetical protein